MTEELIRRSDAIEALYKYDFVSKDVIEREINAIPTIEPKRERCEYCKDGDFIGQRQMLGNDGKWHKIRFCPNCGARMKGADDE